MIIALAQTNPTIGDIVGNTDQMIQAIVRARQAGAVLVIFPELSIIGYPPKDLLLVADLIDQCAAAVSRIAAESAGLAAIVGYPYPADHPEGRSLHNAAAICSEGRIVHRCVKSLLPTYDVFDEQRYFEPAHDCVAPYELNGVRLGVSICEDMWNDQSLLPRRLYHDDPIQKLVAAGADVLVNCSASPFVVDKHTLRLALAGATARRYGMGVIYCNQVGGNDELVFDGNSFVVDRQGKLVAHAKDFQEDLLLVELACGRPARAPTTESGGLRRIGRPKQGIESVYHALVLGLRDYCRKCRFESIVVGLSGGIDSAVTCALAVAAIGPSNVSGVAMPSRYSSDGSKLDSADLARRLGVGFRTISIDGPHTAMEALLAAHLDGGATGVTGENLQARLRGTILMALSNRLRSLLVTTGNKSELAVGYCTLYGDMCGGLAVLSDVPKSMVWRLARWINESADSPLRRQFGGPVIPENSISKPPSAELRPDQVDQDSLPPYDVLDTIIERYVEQEQSVARIVSETGFDLATVRRMARLIDLNEYKRKQAAPGLKITSRAFGFGRRMPIAHQRSEP